jgi:hypothetical protein
MNVLFTSVGRRVELLKAFRTAYRSLQLEGCIIALDIDPLAPALRLADRSYIVPRLDSLDYIPTLVDICAKERADVVFPLIDPDVQVLSQHRAQIEAVGARLAVVSIEAAKTCDAALVAAGTDRPGHGRIPAFHQAAQRKRGKERLQSSRRSGTRFFFGLCA